MSWVEDKDVVQAFAPNRTDQPFDVRRWPGRARSDPDRFQAQSYGAAPEFQTVNAIAVTEQIFRRRGKGKRFTKSLDGPVGGGHSTIWEWGTLRQ